MRRALTGQSHDYKRHGTTDAVCGTRALPPGRSSRRIQNGGGVVEFRRLHATASLSAFQDSQLHVILDQTLNTHKKNEHWLKATTANV